MKCVELKGHLVLNSEQHRKYFLILNTLCNAMLSALNFFYVCICLITDLFCFITGGSKPDIQNFDCNVKPIIFNICRTRRQGNYGCAMREGQKWDKLKHLIAKKINVRYKGKQEFGDTKKEQRENEEG